MKYEFVKGMADGVVTDESTEDQTPDPGELMKQATQAASVASVNGAFRHHIKTCPALRWIRFATVIVSIALGCVLTAQVVFALWGKTIIRDTVFEAMRNERDSQGGRHRSGLVIPSALAADVGKPPIEK